MKELTIEEKAKAYDKIIGIAKKELDACGSQDCDAARQIFRLFPELKESKDEKIRKAIKKALQVRCDGSRIISDEPVTLEEAIEWLEKQGEQKPIEENKGNHGGISPNSEWSEEDEDILNTIINHFKVDIECTDEDDVVRWLKSLKERFNK